MEAFGVLLGIFKESKQSWPRSLRPARPVIYVFSGKHRTRPASGTWQSGVVPVKLEHSTKPALCRPPSSRALPNALASLQPAFVGWALSTYLLELCIVAKLVYFPPSERPSVPISAPLFIHTVLQNHKLAPIQWPSKPLSQHPARILLSL